MQIPENGGTTYRSHIDLKLLSGTINTRTISKYRSIENSNGRRFCKF